MLPYRLLAPGPVPVPIVVLKAMSEKVLHHRTLAFEKILQECWAGLKVVFATKQPVLLIAGSGTAAMEAAAVNMLSPGDDVLVVVSGKFGERWADICERQGAKVQRWNVEWGSALDMNTFEQLVKANPTLKAVFSQACETSTASLNPIKEMAAVIRKNSQALFAVDAIAAAGCTPLEMDAWGIDVMVAGSQKAFMIPAGLSFIALSEKAWAAQKQSRIPKYYFDLAAEKKMNEKKEPHFSIPTALVTGLAVVLRRWQETGSLHVQKRCAVLAQTTRECGEMIGLPAFSQSPSPSVTALKTPADIDSTKLREWLEAEKNITVMGGQDQLKGKILRVGHMGDVRNEDMEALFQALCEYLKKDYSKIEGKLKAGLTKAEPLFP